jgi:hypothetical protein
VATYYTIDGRFLRLREYRRMTRSPLALLHVAVRKLLGLPIPLPVLIPRVERLPEADWDDLPAEARAALAGPVAEWERFGFRRVCAVRLPRPQKRWLVAGVLLLAPDGTTAVHVVYADRPDGVFVWPLAFTAFRDGTVGMTTGQKQELDDAPTVRRASLTSGASSAEGWDAHRANLTGRWAELEPERLDAAGAKALAVEMDHRWFDHHIARGAMVPVTDEEYDRLADAE